MTEPTLYLLLEDEDAIPNLRLMRVLGREGYRVSSTEEVNELIQLVRDELPDAILIDLDLKGADEFAAYGLLIERNLAAPVILLAQVVDDALREDALSAGFHAVVQRPIDLVPFLELLQAAVE